VSGAINRRPSQPFERNAFQEARRDPRIGRQLAARDLQFASDYARRAASMNGGAAHRWNCIAANVARRAVAYFDGAADAA